MFWTGIGVGVLAGALLALPAAWLLVRRSARRARFAERRASESRRLAEIGAMTGGLAHEIKNPLSTIGLNAQLLAEAVAEMEVGEDDRALITRRVGTLRREIDRLRDILEDFLRFAGAVRLELRTVDLNTLVDELVDFYAPQAHRHGVRLTAQSDPAPQTAQADPGQLKQALLNLMINATQAMSGDAASPGPRELMLRTETAQGVEGPERRVHVIDTGPGISAEAAQQIFTPYFSTRPGGAGLGLPITRRLIEEHGGRIDVHSEPGKGTDFVVSLPAPQDER